MNCLWVWILTFISESMECLLKFSNAWRKISLADDSLVGLCGEENLEPPPAQFLSYSKLILISIFRQELSMVSPEFAKMGYPGTDVAQFLGVMTSSLNRLAASEQLPDLNRYLKML